jgi:hypothetical protein
MKVICAATLIAVSAILGCGPGVPTQNLSTTGSTIEVISLGNENKSSGLNPRHGEPGHRCDIAVGQPLDSKPTRQRPLIVNPLTIAPGVPADGLNPKHGQPGHRCDIPVGQPLNSKPAKATTTNSTTSPAVTATQNMNVQPANGLNPKHGQPGHRCDILVGQPLNGKPAMATTKNRTTSPAFTFPKNTGVVPADGLNPKHGQPGHRCDILVGQPLNSTPAPAQ